MTYAIAALYAASLVEISTLARIGVRIVMGPEPSVKHGARYRGVQTDAAYRYRLAAESNRTA